DLTRVGTRTDARWIAEWLADPRAFRSTARMPRIALASDERRDVAAFLAALGRAPPKTEPAPAPKSAPVDPPAPPDPPPPEPQPDPKALVERGRAAFDAVGCGACHGVGGGDLVRLGEKTSATALADYLLDPLAVDRTGAMPSLFTHNGPRAREDREDA